MKNIRVSQRTAYDYYNALLNLNYLSEAIKSLHERKQMLKEKEMMEKEGIKYPLTIPGDEWI